MNSPRTQIVDILNVWGGLGDVGRRVAHHVLTTDDSVETAYAIHATRPAFQQPRNKNELIYRITEFVAVVDSL